MSLGWFEEIVVDVPVTVPMVGPKPIEGVVVEWYIVEGEEVCEGDALVEVETEKMNVMVESPADGVLCNVLAEKDDVVLTGEVIATIRKEKK